MEQLIKDSIIKTIVFSVYGDLGPQALYIWPELIKLDKGNPNKACKIEEDIVYLTNRDATQIAIKNLSLLIGDGSILEQDNLKKYQYFGIIPFPDYNLTSLTYFHFTSVEYTERPLPSAFSILIPESKRNFLYNNIERFKEIIFDLFKAVDVEIAKEINKQEELEPLFKNFINQIIKIEKEPTTPLSAHRKLKIIMAGLDDSGKTSFLLSVDRKYSKLIGLKPTRGAKVNSIEALGATIFLWDLGGQLSLRKKYLAKAQIYLYEADLLFYFIDIRNKSRFEESIKYLSKIKMVLERFEQQTPIVFILSKADPDIIDSKEIQENVEEISVELKKFVSNGKPEIYKTTIFQLFSILRAFSSGISKLSPNRDLINLNLKRFSKQTNVPLALLLSMDGLVLADHYTSEAITITKMPKSEELINVFEITAPQFAVLFKIFSKYKAVEQDEAIFKIAKSVIFFKRIKISETNMFFLLLLDNEKKKDLINREIPNFLNQIGDLLLRYIS
jgi:GTPase SAR1 family protein